jgi:CMP-N,N'-diacetyllegionaminic acid synthase
MGLMTKKILAIIPARGGSKGLPRKNIVDLGGKPLIVWTIEASLSSNYITKTVVSSDSDEVLQIAKEHGVDVLKRPNEFATDTASSESVIKHALESLNEDFDYLVVLQPTSPLRTAKDIDSSFEKMMAEYATSLISVCNTDNKILKAFKENDSGYIEGISNNKYPFERRQNLPKTYMSNGAIYIIKVSEFLELKSLYTDKTIAFLMDEVSSIDIDNQRDLQDAEGLLQ